MQLVSTLTTWLASCIMHVEPSRHGTAGYDASKHARGDAPASSVGLLSPRFVLPVHACPTALRQHQLSE
jgi:hypothetical protein